MYRMCIVCSLLLAIWHVLLPVIEHPEIRKEVANKNEQLTGFLKGMVVDPERMGEVRNMFKMTVEICFISSSAIYK